MTDAIAHTDTSGRRHSLEEHLVSVSKAAADFAGAFGAGDWARPAGLWHDLGKYRSGFQRYIIQANDADSHIEGKVSGPDKTHSAAGAFWAQRYLAERLGPQGEVIARVLSYVIAGHHAGLDNWHGGLTQRFARDDTRREFDDTMAVIPPDAILRPNFCLPSLATLPADKRGSNDDVPGRFALWVRMLFSSLVDADFLDTEAFMDEKRSIARTAIVPLDTLSEQFETHMASKLDALRANGMDRSLVNRLRADVLRQCRQKAELAPGVFSLTVPTGGGKTLSSLAFALRHAVAHGKRRIVYAIPYTSIIEQTADTFGKIFGHENVVEHHSNVESEPEHETIRSRLACENWDSTLIVTTNVQLFESLFARRTSRCRKLHNLVGSVIVLDEAQLLPVDFLQPIVDVLRLLVSEYGVTLVLCTATQPALTRHDGFDKANGLQGFAHGDVTEIVDDVPALFQKLRRVRVDRPLDLTAKRTWKEVAKQLFDHPVVLTIVNRRADARELFSCIRAEHPDGLHHLSALMCAEHRSAVIARIKTALEIGRKAQQLQQVAQPVRVVSTQLVEAGVDIDFPVVFRAMAGLDSIAQAAGRCNREGRLDGLGQTYVFVPPSLPPPGLLRQAAEDCRTVWSQLDIEDDPIDVELYQVYFRLLYARDLDVRKIRSALAVGRAADVRFRDVAETFKLIDDKDAATVIVRYRNPDLSENVDTLIGQLETEGPRRWLMRKLQRYGVSIYRRDAERLLRRGDIRCARQCPGLYVQASDVLYDPALGLLVDEAPGDPAAYFF